eukprot:5661189-Pleurochrysis_carterae.AAC.1
MHEETVARSSSVAQAERLHACGAAAFLARHPRLSTASAAAVSSARAIRRCKLRHAPLSLRTLATRFTSSSTLAYVHAGSSSPSSFDSW